MTRMDQNSIKDILRIQKPFITKQYRVEGLALFGSWARGEASDKSDIDILVDFLPGADLLDLSGLKIYLEDVFGRTVDVVPKRALREELRSAILADATYI